MDRTLSRRTLLGTATAAALIRPAAAQITGVTPIFINWAPWYDTELVNRQYAYALSRPEWQFRAPWFAQVKGTHRLTIEGTQANVDTELLAASNAGIKAFAYVWYGGGATNDNPPVSLPLHKGWGLYNSSPNKNLVKWCGMIPPRSMGYNPWSNTAGWQANVNQWVSNFQQTNYLKIGTRPVLFCLWTQSEVATYYGGSNANVTTTFNYLRSQSIAGGAGDPYIVAMGDPYGNNPTSAELIPIIAGSAISNYVPRLFPTVPIPATHADLDALTQAWWASQVATGQKVVPNALLGWDIRPRYQTPGPSMGYPTPWLGNSSYYTRGTNAQVAAHLQSCVNFIGANQPACDSKMMLVYAWNEFDEGGVAACPTLGDPPTGSPPTTNLLTAIKPVLTAAA